jgi:hypothetical protein
MACPLIRRQIEGIADGALDDLEGMALVNIGDRRFIFALSSLSLKKRKKWHRKRSKRGKVFPPRNGMLRISQSDGRFVAEIVSDFRGWLVENVPELRKSSRYLPDDGGLNVEALGWNPVDQTLQLGVRTPVFKRKPLIMRVHLKQIEGPWDLSNFELLPAVALHIEDSCGDQGIRALDYDESRNCSLVVVGNSTSSSKAPFRLYLWDGNENGEVTPLSSIKFHKKMRVEGVTRGTIYGRGAIVFVDDAGGYQVVWDDPPIQ